MYYCLQALVAQRERQSEKYCQLLQEARSELRSRNKNHEKEVASLVRKLQEQSDSAVRRLREVSMETVAVSTVAGVTEKELARLRELEDMIGQQRVAYEARLADAARERERDKQEYETSLVRIRQEMGELKSSHFIENESQLIFCILYNMVYLYSSTLSLYVHMCMCVHLCALMKVYIHNYNNFSFTFTYSRNKTPIVWCWFAIKD